MSAKVNRCPQCREDKPEEAFYRNSSRKSGRAVWCKTCSNGKNNDYRRQSIKHQDWAKRRSRKRRLAEHQLTEEEFNDLYWDQDGSCAICHRPLITTATAIDHSHKTQKVRGLLCRKCNMGLGLFLDSPTLLDAAAYYVRTHAEQ
jgi:5-methylcytosine-specific restriction endonuclease McrA